MSLVADGLEDVEERAAAGAENICGAAVGVEAGEDVHAVDDFAGYAVGPGAPGEFVDIGDFVDASGHACAVVFDGIEHGDVELAGHVEGFVEAAGVHGAVASEAEDDAVRGGELCGEACAAGYGEAAADDAVGAEVVLFEFADVHGAAFASAYSGGLSEHLGHHGAHVRTLGDGMAVAAVV